MQSKKGSLKEISVIKLLLSIYNNRLTGILYLKKETITKVLYFKKGRLIWALSNSQTDKLENMLVSEGNITQETLDNLTLTDADYTETIGKILVEKGIITLKELINLTKTQLEKIIFSVLRYKTGNYQFVKDPPPKRLLSLDIDITNFIRNFILDEINESEIWQELKSLQTIYGKNSTIEIEKYNFSKQQLELLNSFGEGQKLEHIMAKYSSGHKNSLLKIIYFFELAGLIVEKDEITSQHSDLEKSTDESFDSILSDSEPKPDKEPSKGYTFKEDKVISDPKDTKEIRIELDNLNSPAKEEEPKIEKPKKITKSSLDQMDSVEQMLKEEEEKSSKKSKKFLLAFFIVIIIGLGLYYVFNYYFDHEKAKVEKIQQKKTKSKPIIIPALNDAQKELKPITKKETENISNPITDFKKEKPKPTIIKKEHQITKQETELKSNTLQNDREKDRELRKDAIKYLLEKKFMIATDIWKNQLIKHKIQYSILLELDCLKESVLKAYRKMNNNKDFFILLQKRDNQICYLVFYGRFASQAAAKVALREIPDYFFLQQNPPVIILITKYLK